jgi:hypothetical protein
MVKLNRPRSSNEMAEIHHTVVNGLYLNAQLPVLHAIAYKAVPVPYPYNIRSVEHIISVNTTEDHSSLILFHIIKSTTPATPTPFPHKTHTHIEHVNRKSRTPARNFHQHQRRRRSRWRWRGKEEVQHAASRCILQNQGLLTPRTGPARHARREVSGVQVGEARSSMMGFIDGLLRRW